MTNPLRPPLVRKIPQPIPSDDTSEDKLLIRRGTRWQRGVILLKRKISLEMEIRENLWKKETQRKTPISRMEDPSRRRTQKKTLVRRRVINGRIKVLIFIYPKRKACRQLLGVSSVKSLVSSTGIESE